MSKRNYWLMKSEPDAFSIDDLKKAGTEPWDGIRNYQARNFMKDEMQIGDGVLFYHSSVKPPAIVGTMEVAGKPYPDGVLWKRYTRSSSPRSKQPLIQTG